jgi:hypothetical protein
MKKILKKVLHAIVPVLVVQLALLTVAAVAFASSNVLKTNIIRILATGGDLTFKNSAGTNIATLTNAGVFSATGGSSGSLPNLKNVSTETLTLSQTPIDVPGVSWVVAASTSYRFQCDLLYTNGTNGNAPQFGINLDVATSVLVHCDSVSTSAVESDVVATDDGACASTTAVVTGTDVGLFNVFGLFTTGVGATDADLRIRSENAAQSVTILEASYCTLEQL